MKAISILLSCLILLPGCATITRGTSEVLVIETVPAGATARLSTGRVCVTPCALDLPRKQGFTIQFEKEGYKNATATVTSGIKAGGSVGMAGNVLIGGLIGAAVDGTSGAMKDLIPNPVKVTLEKID